MEFIFPRNTQESIYKNLEWTFKTNFSSVKSNQATLSPYGIDNGMHMVFDKSCQTSFKSEPFLKYLAQIKNKGLMFQSWIAFTALFLSPVKFLDDFTVLRYAAKSNLFWHRRQHESSIDYFHLEQVSRLLTVTFNVYEKYVYFEILWLGILFCRFHILSYFFINVSFINEYKPYHTSKIVFVKVAA